MKFVTPPMFEQNAYGVDVNSAMDQGDDAAQVEAERNEVYRKYRQKLIEATDAIESLAEDFTGLEFSDSRELLIFSKSREATEAIEAAFGIRSDWFNARIGTTEGGAA